jgi:hypothetical protein
MKLALGMLLVLVGTLALLWNLRESYLTQGGAIGQVPVVAAAAIQVPLVMVLGIALIDGATNWLGLEWWHYLLAWFGLALFAGTITVWAGKLGSSRQASHGAQ